MTLMTRSGVAALAAALLAFGSHVLRAQDGYDQQQWWNPGDWFDAQPQYNLYSDRYWNDTYGGYDDSDTYGSYDRFDSTFDYDDYGYGTYDPWAKDSEDGFYDSWDYDASEWGYDDSLWSERWDEDQTGLGTMGGSESGFGSDWEE